jgi:hypothetical protein
MMKLMDETRAEVVYGQRRMRDGTCFTTLTAAFFIACFNVRPIIQSREDTDDLWLISKRAVEALNDTPEHCV